MIDLGIKFPSEARQALDNACEYGNMPVSRRYEMVLALATFAYGTMKSGGRFAERMEIHDRQAQEEMRALLDVQRRGHV